MFGVFFALNGSNPAFVEPAHLAIVISQQLEWFH